MERLTNRVIVAGSTNMDVVALAESMPRPGETIPGSRLRFTPGGKGANQAVAASRLGAPTTFVSRVGADSFGETLAQFLSSERLDLAHLSRSPSCPSGTALIIVTFDAQNHIIVIAGANGELSTQDVAGVPISEGDVILAQLEIPQLAILALFERAKREGAICVLNAAPAIPVLPALQASLDYLVVNETELSFYARPIEAEEDGVRSSLAEIEASARTIKSPTSIALLVTLGAQGAIAILDNEVEFVQGPVVDAVDTTGAGDCFCGAFAVALTRGLPMRDTLAFANAAAAVSVTREGAATSMPTLQEVQRAYPLVAGGICGTTGRS